MSYFFNIYICSHNNVKEKLSKSSVQEFEKLLKEDVQKESLTNLLNKNYDRDPETLIGPDAPELIESLEIVCELTAKKKAIIEFYLDDEAFPELSDFAFDDWDVEDDFELPLSEYGTPSVIYRDYNSLNVYLEKFKKALDEETFDEDCISEEELESLINIISEALEQKTGMFIFCYQ